jgi:4-hydroxy-tetrahydrodipicolinate synthase
VLPTFTSDLSGLNEAAIRHDVEMEGTLGMGAVLVVSECGTTMAEYRRFLEIVIDGAGDLVVVVQASQPTWDAMQQTIEWGAELGADIVLPSYPLTYHPRTLDELYADNRRMIDRAPLGVLLFAMDQWNFARLHPAGFPVELLDRLVADCPNLVGIKNEIGLPYLGGMDDVFARYGDQVVVTDPMESNAPVWVKHYGMRFMGTSNYEAYGARIPQMLNLLGDPATWDAGMALYWGNTPIRRANSAIVGPTVAATGMVPRSVWKYQGWLLGFNGGPMRGPLARINSGQMAMIRKAARDAGLDVTDDPDELFWTGRNAA